MNREHEKHLRRVQGRIAARIGAKYRRGQREHGGQLWRKPALIQEALDEVCDLAVYLETLREQLECKR